LYQHDGFFSVFFTIHMLGLLFLATTYTCVYQSRTLLQCMMQT